MNLLSYHWAVIKTQVDTEEMLQRILGGEGYSFVDDESGCRCGSSSTHAASSRMPRKGASTSGMAELKERPSEALIVTDAWRSGIKRDYRGSPGGGCRLGTTSYGEIAGSHKRGFGRG